LGASFLISLREGIEAALIVSILLAYLKQIHKSDKQPLVWWGAGLAVVMSIVVGAVIFAVGAEFEGTAEQVFEGLVTLAAVVVLFFVFKGGDDDNDSTSATTEATTTTTTQAYEGGDEPKLRPEAKEVAVIKVVDGQPAPGSATTTGPGATPTSQP